MKYFGIGLILGQCVMAAFGATTLPIAISVCVLGLAVVLVDREADRG